MFKSLRRRLYNWLQQEHRNQDLGELKPLQVSDFIQPHNRLLTSQPLSFNLYRASGGWIVETRNHNDPASIHGVRTTPDESRPKLHIIHDDQDLGTALGKIVFMENLQK